ncbi:hypothetical protein ACFQZ8_27175, partial [Micromonospora azadirachtae]
MDRSTARPFRTRLVRALLAASTAAAILPFAPPAVATAAATRTSDVQEQTDACPWGYTASSTVLFGQDRADSGVPNRDRGDGCTIMDAIWGEAPFTNHGSFLLTVTRVTGSIKAAGVITSAEQVRILLAAALSDVGKRQWVTGTRAVPDRRIGLVLYTVRAGMPAAPEATLA